MNETNLELLRRYWRDRSEEAFAEIVRRHVDLVYSVAFRRVRSAELAKDVAQSVFTDLARSAQGLSAGTILPAWLYQVTRRTAIDVVRRESRRQLREQVAAEMHAMNSAEADWTQIEPLLDEAMEALDVTDRAAILLRYFQNKSLREVGQTLGTSEDGAQKRVSRAVERLRVFFGKHGVSVGANGVAVVISANAVQAAPAGLAGAISATSALAGFSLTASSGAVGTTCLFQTLSQVTGAKVVAGVAVTAVVGFTALLVFIGHHRVGQDVGKSKSHATAPNTEQTLQGVPPATKDANLADAQHEPDARSLFLAVAEARQRINSGSMDLQVTLDRYKDTGKETSQHRLIVLFDGSKRRFDERSRQYAYAYSPNEAKAEEIVKRADSMDRESAIREGLLEAHEYHEIMATDGATLLKYQEQRGITSVNDPPTTGSVEGGGYFFDARYLGLRTGLPDTRSIEYWLSISKAKSINLVGRESVEGIPAWHVQVPRENGPTLDFWFDAARSDRVLKQSEGNAWVLSKYDETNPSDPIPVEVRMRASNPDGSPWSDTRFIRSTAQFNMPVDPASFTLAGLGMPVGTSVSDARIHRLLGYWTGIGFSEQPPPKTSDTVQPAPNMAVMLRIVESNPASDAALNAAAWIILNTPDGPEVGRAADVIVREHTRNTNLVYLCTELGRVRPRSSKPLLEAILKDNPSIEVRGTACFTLATVLKDEAQYGQNKQATAAAEKNFERVISEFGQVKQPRGFLRHWAEPELAELRFLTIGNPAPEIEGEDLDGRPMKLSDYRGKVVVLTFWLGSYTDLPEHRTLVARMAGRPFAFIGVFSDEDPAKAKAVMEKYGVAWPSFWDGRVGSIRTKWNVHSYPNVWVLDAQGVIRYREVRGRDLWQAVETLLEERAQSSAAK